MDWTIDMNSPTAGRYVANVSSEDCVASFRSDNHPSSEDARAEAQAWIQWFEKVPHGGVDSIYYILCVPDTWAGPPAGSHRYSGLSAKIGRSTNIKRRLSNLQTGSNGQLIINALEPGGAEREAELHRLFEAERRGGEWFSCSPDLERHMMQTWDKYNAMPHEHQMRMLGLMERIDQYRAIREYLGGAPDMINPSISESWTGKVVIDLVHSSLGRRISDSEKG